jgi:hypothetical protein
MPLDQHGWNYRQVQAHTGHWGNEELGRQISDLARRLIAGRRAG